MTKVGLSAATLELARNIYRAVGTPLSAELLRKLEAGEWDYIAECKVDPRAYTNAQEYFLDAVAASLLRKCKDIPSSHNRRASALKTWWDGERACLKTNRRLDPYLEGFSHPSCDSDVAAFISRVRRKISDCLGRAPAINQLQPRHGPGATFSDKSIRSTVAHKMSVKPSMTSSAVFYLLDWWGTAWGRESSAVGRNPVMVRGNRFATAPKDATKERPIGAEPSINVFYQLGLDGEVRSRLKRCEIDLDEGQSWHRYLACAASLTGTAATLDLTNASGCLAYNLVKLLLEPDWFELFNELRSPFTRMRRSELLAAQGKPQVARSRDEQIWVKLEQFSSMGNGYTFALESLIFWALTESAVESLALDGPVEKTYVYGDDIICDSRAVYAVISVLRFFGFEVNNAKSYVDGPFRESCGGDFWDGRAVRPFFLKESLDEPQQLIAAANQVRRVAKDLFGGLGAFATAWYALQTHLPLRVRRCRGPEGLGDHVLHCDERTWGWTSRRRDRVFVYRPVKHRKVSLECFGDGTVLACGLYGITVSEGFVLPRDSVTGYAVRKGYIKQSQWLPQPRIVRSGPSSVPTLSSGVRIGPNYERAYRVASMTKR